MCGYGCVSNTVHLYILIQTCVYQDARAILTKSIGRLQCVGFLKYQVSFVKEPYKNRALLRKRSRNLESLLLVATPYTFRVATRGRTDTFVRACIVLCGRGWMFAIVHWHIRIHAIVCTYIYDIDIHRIRDKTNSGQNTYLYIWGMHTFANSTACNTTHTYMHILYMCTHVCTCHAPLTQTSTIPIWYECLPFWFPSW